MVALELQAIVLAAGNGSRMTELSGERPKCLLPVGPLPLVWYPLHMLQEHGFQGARNPRLKKTTSDLPINIY